MIVPVPLHWRRGWSRRYNQSGALAKVIGRIANVPVAGRALKRIRPTPQQIGLSRSERARNVQGAFQVPAERRAEVEGRRIVLVDDVLTIRRNRGRLRTCAAAREGRQRRCAGVCASCRRRAKSYIIAVMKDADRGKPRRPWTLTHDRPG